MIRVVKTSQYVLLFVIIPKRLTFAGVKLLAPAFKIDKRNKNSLSFFYIGHKF